MPPRRKHYSNAGRAAVLLIKNACQGLMGVSRPQLLAINPKDLSWCKGLGLQGSRRAKRYREP